VSGPARVEAILRATPWFMAALEAARRVEPPDWLIGAGALRTAVWDHLHGFESPTALADIDPRPASRSVSSTTAPYRWPRVTPRL
jgi:hypothetical protein